MPAFLPLGCRWSSDAPDRFLDLLSGFEVHDAVAGDRHLLPCLGIVGILSSGSLSDLECAETTKLDGLPLGKSGLQFLEQFVDDFVDLVAAEVILLGPQAVDDVGLGKFRLFEISG